MGRNNLTNYQALLKVRSDNIDGVSDWVWVKEDEGAWLGPSKEWYDHKKTLLDNVPVRNVVIQAGGNCGLYPRLFANYFNRVYTFEPDPLNFHCLVNNCQQDNIIKFNCALGDENRLVSVQRGHMGNVGTHTIGIKDNNIIPQITIDSLNVDCCDLIQLDVEGYEIKILNGAISTIDKYKPIITVENGFHPPIVTFFNQHNYESIGQIGSDTIYRYRQ
jgi:FkbM family methyltransferase